MRLIVFIATIFQLSTLHAHSIDLAQSLNSIQESISQDELQLENKKQALLALKRLEKRQDKMVELKEKLYQYDSGISDDQSSRELSLQARKLANEAGFKLDQIEDKQEKKIMATGLAFFLSISSRIAGTRTFSFLKTQVGKSMFVLFGASLVMSYLYNQEEKELKEAYSELYEVIKFLGSINIETRYIQMLEDEIKYDEANIYEREERLNTKVEALLAEKKIHIENGIYYNSN